MNFEDKNIYLHSESNAHFQQAVKIDVVLRQLRAHQRSSGSCSFEISFIKFYNVFPLQRGFRRISLKFFWGIKKITWMRTKICEIIWSYEWIKLTLTNLWYSIFIKAISNRLNQMRRIRENINFPTFNSRVLEVIAKIVSWRVYAEFWPKFTIRSRSVADNSVDFNTNFLLREYLAFHGTSRCKHCH